MTTPRQTILRGAAAAGCLVVSFLFGGGVARAGLGGSLHDWSTDTLWDKTGDSFPAHGMCSACHIPHFSQGAVLWPRSLTAEASDYNQASSPNYVPGRTLLCYDCHDTGTATDADDDPQRGSTGVWVYTTVEPYHEPQDIARSAVASDSSLWKTTVGYYEKYDGTLTPPAPTAGSPTGGHYWKSTPVGMGAPAQGDKIACELCHDPHNAATGTNNVFLRTSAWDGDSWEPLDGAGGATASDRLNLRKSKNARKPEGTDTRESGRKMCTLCHGYSDAWGQEIFYNNAVPKPPSNITAHAKTANEDDPNLPACTNCHKHNRIVASCSECHGFPPLLTEVEGEGTFAPNDQTNPKRKFVENYTNGAGAHRRHLDALGVAIFDCAICHGADPGSAVWHNQNNGTVLQANVNIKGLLSWWGAGSSYNGTTSGGDATYAFNALGAAPQVCANLACHGYPTGTSGDAGALNWTDDMVDDATNAATVDIEVCHWCHDATPAVLDKDGAGTTYTPVKAPNIMGAGSGNAAWGAKVNGHGLASGSYEGDALGTTNGRAAANKECTACHDATYTAGTAGATYTPGSADKTHFDGSYYSAGKRLNDSINGQTLSTLQLQLTNGTLGDAACIACHQRSGGTLGSMVSSHGNTSGNYTRLEAQFQALCRACHEPHGRNFNGATRNLHMVGAWPDSHNNGSWGVVDAGEEARVDSNMATVTPAPAVAITTADSAVVFTSRTGADSFDEVDTVWTQDTDDICATCHSQATGGGNGTGGGSHAGTLNYGTDERGTNCTASCHDHDYDDSVATYSWDAFLPKGGPDMEQFFDTAFNAANYNAVSGHALDLRSTKTYSVPPDCVSCHKTAGGTGVSNECLKCHYEGYVSGSSWIWAGHANGSQTLELRTTSSPDPPYNAACNPGTNCIRIPRRSANVDADGTDDVYTHCLVCHDQATVGPTHRLGSANLNPPDIVPSGTWTGGIGHGASASLSSSRGANAAGPPAYDCGACHSSTVPVAAGKPWPSYHASINLKLVANTTSPYQTAEYDTTVEKNSWCLSRCHRTDGQTGLGKDNNADNGIAKDNNVIDHTWAPDSSETADQTDCPLGAVDPNTGLCETHPSYDTIVPGTLFQLPPGLPYDTGTNRFTCVTCHEPHGNPASTDGQMIRINYNSTGALCDQCHL